MKGKNILIAILIVAQSFSVELVKRRKLESEDSSSEKSNDDGYDDDKRTITLGGEKIFLDNEVRAKDVISWIKGAKVNPNSQPPQNKESEVSHTDVDKWLSQKGKKGDKPVENNKEEQITLKDVTEWLGKKTNNGQGDKLPGQTGGVQTLRFESEGHQNFGGLANPSNIAQAPIQGHFIHHAHPNNVPNWNGVVNLNFRSHHQPHFGAQQVAFNQQEQHNRMLAARDNRIHYPQQVQSQSAGLRTLSAHRLGDAPQFATHFRPNLNLKPTRI